MVKREFSIPFDAVKTENAQHSEKKIQPIKKIVIEKIQKKIWCVTRKWSTTDWRFKV